MVTQDNKNVMTLLKQAKIILLCFSEWDEDICGFCSNLIIKSNQQDYILTNS